MLPWIHSSTSTEPPLGGWGGGGGGEGKNNKFKKIIIIIFLSASTHAAHYQESVSLGPPAFSFEVHQIIWSVRDRLLL